MPDYKMLIQSAVAAKTAIKAQSAAADRLWKRGDYVEWRGPDGWRSGLVVATDYGRRLFVEDAQTSRCSWISIGTLRSKTDPDRDISEEIRVSCELEAAR
ncbi:hypothetical protein [Maricaulis sp.]|uniref:hypothetical protein n=1 Tax=Maricaulis sp. TaxID=1486257 RepID=UPI003297E971